MACDNEQNWRKVSNMEDGWYYSGKAFVEFKDRLERRLNWRYSGDVEMIILQSNPEKGNILNFENYLAIDLNYGIQRGYIESFPRFMESLIRSSRSEVETIAFAKDMRRGRLKIRQVLETTLDDCKKVPTPVRRVIKDRLFYRPARFYSEG